MRTSTFYNRYIKVLCLLLLLSSRLFAQHNFATTQNSGASSLLCLGCTVTNPANAVDGNLQTASTLNVTVGLLAATYQEMIFPGASKVAAGTPVTIKLGTGDNLLNLTVLGAISIQPYNGSAPAGAAVTAATLLTAVSNNNQVELIVTPNQVFDRIRVTLNGGVVGALSSIYLYDAFYTGSNAASCNVPFDELHGISAGLLNLGVDIGGVANPQNAIDGNINTASTLNAGVNVLGAYAQQTIIFQQTSVLGDSVRLTLAVPQTLLSANVLSSISLVTYNGNTNNNDAVFLNSNLLNVRLLGLISIGSNLSKVVVTYAPSKLFDRVQVRLGSVVANVLSTLNLYEVEKLIPRPVVKINGVVTNNASLCAGSTATFNVTAVPNTTFAWYTSATGGTAIAGAGATFTTPALNATTTYYVGASRVGCTNESERTPVVVTVNQVPVAPVIANGSATVCPGSTATFSAAAVTGVTVSWYANPTGGTALFTGNSYTTAALTQTTSFYAEAVAGGTCFSATRTKVTATVSPLPAVPTLTAINTTICDGDVAILSIASPVAGQTYNWYSTATGGTVLFTGVNFTTPALHASTSYYAEAVNVTGCASATRVQANVAVTPKPADPVLAANNQTVSAGQSATITVSNAQAGITYNWYTSAAAATPVFTGNPYATPLLYSSTTYYVGAVNATGCQSVNRTAITINVTINNNSPCTFANAQTNDVNGVCVLCGITNPALATDADTTTASTLTVTAGLLGGYSEQTVQFQQAGFAGDTIKLVLQGPVALASVGVLSNIQVAFLNGATVGTTYTLDNSLIKVRLLAGTNRYVVYIPANAAYDRIRIRLNSGVASLLTSLQIYYALQQYPQPVFNPASTEVCKGSPATVAITAPTPANGTFNWYAAPTGGTSLHAGTTYTTPALNANTTYYVEYSRGTCVSPVRYAVQITVDDPPVKPTVTPTSATINAGQTATFKATAATNAVIKWYSAATGGTALFTGSTFTTPNLSASTTYYAEAVLGNCVSPDRTVVPVTVIPLVIPNVTVVPPTQAVNAGTSATITASSTTPGTIFNWYTTPTGGTSIYTGATFTSPAVFTPITYYAEAVVTATGAISATRAAGSVTVNPISSNPVPCDAATIQTNTTSGLLCVLCGISNAAGAVDANSNTFSQLSVPVGLLGGYGQQTLQFANVAHAGDSVIVDLGIPGTLASVGVLSQISLATYNGATYNNDRFSVNGALLNIQLLSGTNRFRVAFKAASDFDRVEIRLNSGVAGVLNALNIYDAAQEVAAPVITIAPTTACAGSQNTITATVPAYVTVKWYTTATGGTPVFTGAVFTTPVLNTTTIYYAEASRTVDGCTQTQRTPVTVTVTPTPVAPVIANSSATVCPGSTATFSAAAVTGVTVNWYANPTGGTALFTGNSYTTAALSQTTSFYAEAVSGGTCVSTTRTKVTATVSPLPATPTLTTASATICDGDVAILSVASPVAGQTYNWYSTATGGTVLFTGVNYTTPALHANAVYYAEAVNVTGCASTSRVQANVTVTPKPADPVLAANNLTINAGQSATISVTNAQTGITYNWYTSAAAATPVFTGTPYATPLLYSNTTYYVGAVNATGCQSVNRTAITINVTINNNAPCTFANAQTNDVNGVCVLCGITNAALATDADTTTASTLTVTAGLLGGYSEQTVQFQQAGFAGDTIRLVLQGPVALASVGVLSNIQVAFLNGATVGTTYTLDNSLIKVRLLAGTGRYVVYIPANAAYDGLRIRLNSGLATLLTSLQVYYALQQYPQPVFNPASTEVCKGSPATVAITAPTPANGTFNWYAAPTGGTSLHAGTTYTTPALNANTTYYVEYSRGTCVSPVRYAVQITVDDPPAKPTVVPASATINAGQTATFKATAATNAIIKWYSAPTGGTALFTGSTFTTPNLSASTTYYAEAVLGNCVSPDRTVVPVTVVPLVIPNVAVAPPTQAINAGTSATLTASSTTPGTIFNWYTTPTGGTSIYTGATFTSPALFAPATYYAEAVVTATGAISATRASGNVTINAISNNPVPCDAAIDQTNTTSGLLCVLCGISNATGSVDANSNTFSQLSVPVGLLGGYAQQTLRFANTGRAGDTVVVDLGIPGTLASVGVLSQINLATYNGATYNNDRFSVNGALLNIQLLSGTNRFRVTFKATADFDRVEIRLNSGVAGVLNALNIYDAAQEVAAPVIATNPVTACAGTQTTITATVPAYVTVKWYTAATGGSPIFTGAVFNTPVLNSTTTYYAEASRTADGCTQTQRTPVTVTVTPTPAAPVVAVPTVTVCSGSPATFAATPVSGVTFNWYAAATGGTPIFTGNSYTTGALNQTTSYYVEATGAGACGSSTRTQVTANVTTTPLVPQVTQATVQTCSGSSAVLSATSTQPGVTFNWYTAATGGTPIFTGPQYTTPALTANTSYYVEAAAGSCVSSTRAKTDVVVNPTPVAPTVTVTPSNAQISSGQTAVIKATSTTAGATFNWYTAASGGTPIFTGATFTTPALSSSQTYYVESTLGATGCTSPTRTPVTITVNPIFSTSCDFASTQSFSVTGLCVGCTVNNPNNAVDADTTNVSQLQLAVSLLGANVSQQLIFGDTGNAGDTVSVKIGLPVSLLTAGVLNGLQIRSYNGATANNDLTLLSSNLLTIRLLAGSQSGIVRFAPKGTYDRIEVTLLGGVASVLNSANIYYATKQVEAPKLAASTVNICQGSTATFTVSNARAGVTYKWYTAAVGGTLAHTGATFTTGALLATTTYYVESSRTSNGCANPNRVSATANVTPSPVNPVLAQASLEICAGDNATLSVTNAGTAIVKWYDAATNGNLLFTGATYIVNPVTTNTYYAELSNGTCTSPARTVATVKVDARPSKPGVVAANVQVCANSTAVLAVLTPEAGVTYSWYTAATGGTAAGTGTTFTTPNISQNIIYYVEASNTTTGCINNGGRTPVNITVSGALTAPVLSAVTTQVCSGGSVTLSVNSPVAGLVYNWYTAATGGTPIFTGTTFTANNLTSDISYFVETANSSGCVSATRTKTTITVLPIPTPPQVTAPAGGLSACDGSTITISITNPQADQVYRWYTAATGGTLLFTGTVFTTPAITATTTYYVEAATAGNCNPSARTPVTVTLTPLPADPTVTATTVPVCSGASATLSVASPQAGITYTWYSSPGMTTALFTGATYITGPISAITNFYVSASNSSGCSSNGLAQVQVTITPPPSAPVVAGGVPVQSCVGSKATLSIDNPTAGFTYNWYSAATGGTPIFTGSSFTTGNLSADVSYYVDAVNATGCGSSGRTQVDVHVNALPIAPIITALGGSTTPSVCAGNSATLVATSATTGVTFNWYAVATGGTPIFTGATYITPPLSAATTYYVEAVSNAGGCASSTRTAVQVTITPPPSAPVVAGGAPVQSCIGSKATLSVDNPTAGFTYNWYSAATGGTPIFTGSSFTTGNLSADISYYVDAVNASGCGSSGRTQVDVHVNALPTAPTITALGGSTTPSVCSGNSATLVATSTTTGVTFNWYAVATGGTPVFTGATYVTPLLSAATTYYVEAVSNTGGCASSTRTAVQVTITPPPSAPVVAGGAPVQSCIGSKATLSVDNPAAGFTYNWYSAATGGTPIFTGSSFTTGNLSADVSYYVDAVNALGCGSFGRTQVDVHVNALPIAPIITDQGGSTTPSVCAGNSATLVATSATTGVTFNWYAVATGGTPVFTGATYITPPLSAATTYYVEAVSNAGGCASSTRTAVQVTINNNTAPTPTVDAAGLSTCQNSAATISITNPVAGTVYNFYAAATGGSSLYTGTSFVTPAVSQNTTYYVEASNATDCKPSVRLAVNVVIVPQPGTPVPTAATVQVCIGSPATLSVASPQAGLTYNWYSSPAKTTKLFTGATYVTGPVNANTTYYVEAANGSCSSSALAAVQVNVNSLPTAPVLVNNGVISCQGNQTTLSVANPQAGFTYSWFANATGGTSLFTGTDFVTPVLNASATYYVEAINATSCSSATRTSATVTVTGAPAAPQISTAGTTVCPGTSATLSATNGANTTITWYAAATGGTALFTGSSYTTPALTATTIYYAEAVNNIGGCPSAVRASVTVTVTPDLAAPTVTVGTTTISTITFNWDAVPGATGYQVSLDNGLTFVTPSTGSAGTTHEVTGLTASQSVTIIVRAVGPCGQGANSAAVTGKTTNPFGNGIFVPNAFTPNGDGNNDLLQVFGNSIQSLTFSVYDQWGGLLFRTTNKSAGWDGTYKGTGQPVGVYVWYLTGTTTDAQPIKMKGTVTLLR
ncbi:gliding motility-associated C-terminal domain-containing protein [Mucilaginibacter sp. FT3.2]|uniref:gliding motility-associated C-terminal domain-containing protein n=1 Tax=Mucilaginibacter sp. FT3.2 TaxID=2723090 RepID=UPI0016163A12|nr:gliding motility-associated C-terminal domain-containing protein [Mucilaginibacter sp. FT3.2]MBB6231121.1 gliding motility-associated-like protein [Mucilaginibacter sp. FT3.2]